MINIFKPDEMSNTTTSKYMATWLQQMNYPKVTVALERDITGQRTTFKFEQSRFLLNDATKKFKSDSPFK